MIMTRVSVTVQEEAKRTQLHSSAAALEARATRAEQQLAAAQRQADAARAESNQLATRLATVEARLADAQQSQVRTVLRLCWRRAYVSCARVGLIFQLHRCCWHSTSMCAASALTSIT